jgi:hypothetical protein
MMIKISPEELEQGRLQEISLDDLKLSQINSSILDATQIQRATPEDLKAMGLAKLPPLLLTIENRVKQIIIKSLEDLLRKEINQFIESNSCPSPAVIENIINVRNNIVGQLNNIGIQVNNLTTQITNTSSTSNSTINTIRGTKGASVAISLAAKAIPSPPGLPGTIASSLNDIQTFIRENTFDIQGNSKLAKISSTIGGASLVISMISIQVQLAISLLNSIDAFLNRCASVTAKSNIIPPSKEIKDIADAQTQADETQNLTTYQGFIIEIEEVPFTPTVTRRRAIGKNQSGIKLIQSELSFSTNNQTLINELKFIIDRDNLKAY